MSSKSRVSDLCTSGYVCVHGVFFWYSYLPFLLQAVLSNHPEVVQYLVEHNATIDCTDVLGYTPLEYAKKLSFLSIVRILDK